MKTDEIKKIALANELVENIKSAILGSVIVTIRDADTNEFLWSCHTDERYGAFKKMKIKIDQDINLSAILREMEIYIEKSKD